MSVYLRYFYLRKQNKKYYTHYSRLTFNSFKIMTSGTIFFPFMYPPLSEG